MIIYALKKEINVFLEVMHIYFAEASSKSIQTSFLHIKLYILLLA